MSKKEKGQIFDENGNQVWRFATPFKKSYVTTKEGRKCVGDNYVVYIPTADPEYAEFLAKGMRGELGQLAQGQGARLGETEHTAEMLARTAIAVGDDEGFLRTTVREHAVHIARVVPGAVLDKMCDQSVLEDAKVAVAKKAMSPGEQAQEALDRKPPVVNTALKVQAPASK